jgi:hypothetical protein
MYSENQKYIGVSDFGFICINMNRIKWNIQSIEKLKYLNNSETPIKDIANQLGGTVFAVNTKLCELGIKSKRVRYFTHKDQQILKDEISKNTPMNEISKKMRRNRAFLSKQVKKLGLFSKRRDQLNESLELRNQGKKRCFDCKNIYPDTSDYFSGKQRMCKQCNAIRHKKFYHILKKDITVEQLLQMRLYQAKYRSNIKEIEFDVDREYLLNLYNKQDGKCFYSGLKMEIALKHDKINNRTLSIDRIDSKKGYTKDNIVLCCDNINTMKMQMDKKEFMNLCKIITDYNIHKR